MMSDLFEGRVFNSIEEIITRYGVKLTLPKDLPEGCNLLCYLIKGMYDIKYFHAYKEDDNLFRRGSETWIYSNANLEDEIKEDISCRNNYIYLRLNKDENKKEVFKPERLLGVETTHGYVIEIYPTCKSELGFYLGLSFEYGEKPESLGFYISDDSDETVSFDEYLDMFYSRG